MKEISLEKPKRKPKLLPLNSKTDVDVKITSDKNKVLAEVLTEQSLPQSPIS